MTRLACILIAGLTFIVLPGCGDSTKTTNIAEDADKTAMEEYEAAVAKESAGMTEPEE